jgi:hypothetical protein
MSESASIGLLLMMALVAASLPWVSERVLFLLPAPAGGKREWMRLLEWAVLYGVVGLAAVGMELRQQGQRYDQDWEFYVVTLCLFMVFALPGFIWHHDLRRHLRRRQRRKR